MSRDSLFEPMVCDDCPSIKQCVGGSLGSCKTFEDCRIYKHLHEGIELEKEEFVSSGESLKND